jgi:hypothetical protein
VGKSFIAWEEGNLNHLVLLGCWSYFTLGIMVLILKKCSTQSAVSGAYTSARIHCVARRCFQIKSAECTKLCELVLCCDAEASPEGATCLDVLY